MAIQALSSVTNKGYSNVSFGKRGEKSAKNQSNPHVVSSLKAVPLAALIAMSPLNTTNAKDMMRSERNQNVIELAQEPQSQNLMYIYAKSFKSANDMDVLVTAVNTEGKKDYFNKVLIKIEDFTFEVKDIINRESYLYSGNGTKEGPLNFKEVITETDLEGKKERFSFIDPNIVNYIEAIIEQPSNQSDLKNVRHANMNLVIAGEEGNLCAVSDEYIKKFLKTANENFVIESGHIARANDRLYAEGLKGVTRIDKWEKHIKGSHGNYTLRFYDFDGDLSNAECILVEKDGNHDCRVTGLKYINGTISGIDNVINTGTISTIVVQTNPFTSKRTYFTDDILADEILKFVKSSQYNSTQEDAINPQIVESDLFRLDD